MRHISSQQRFAIGAAATLLFAGLAHAGEPATREQPLEQRLAELEAQLEQVTALLDAGTTTELEARVDELEATSSEGHDNALGMYWNNGVRFDTADGAFKFALGGRTQVDFAWPNPDSAVVDALELVGPDEINTGAKIRRARLYMGGTIHDNVGFTSRFEFAGGKATLLDVNMQLEEPSIGTITIGKHYEPYGLETLTSDNFITFMERGAPDAFSPQRNTGISVANSLDDGRWPWQIGAYRDSDGAGNDVGNVGDGEWSFTGRIAGVAWEDEDSGDLLHVGIAASRRSPSRMFTGVGEDRFDGVGTKGAQSISTMPLVATGSVAVDGKTTLVNLESAYVAGPLSVQAEYGEMEIETDGGPDAEFDAWSIFASYFLTGEGRPYVRKAAKFGRVEPTTNYGDEDGCGAWEVALRYDEIDFDDGAVRGGEMDQWTCGLTWYLNPNTRWMLNYAEIDIDHVGDIDVVQMRWQIDF